MAVRHIGVLGLLLAVLLAGCGIRPEPQTRISEFQLHQPVSVPEGRARVFLQQGRLVRRIDEFTPHCVLEIRHLHGPPRTVAPGRYPVSRVQRVMTEVVFAAPAHRLAELGVGVGIGVGAGFDAPWFHRVGDYDDSPPEVFEGYHFWLQDPAGSGLLRLTCYGARAMPAEVRPPTLRELAAALGDIGHLIVGN